MKKDSHVVYSSTFGQIHKIVSVCEDTHTDLNSKHSLEIRFDLEALYKKACSNFDEQKK